MSDKTGFEELRRTYKDLLSIAFTNNNIDLLDSFTKKTNETARKAAMDQAFRDKLLELAKEPDLLEHFVTFCIESCRRQMVTPTMPVVLLGDIFDVLTLSHCEKIFSYVENGISIWKEDLFFIACKNNLLRICNDLLRRLSKSQNNIFFGRILLFLAKIFPFSERSKLNINSEFNLEDVTDFGGDSALDEEMVVDSDEAGKINIDYNLYCRFWRLQDFFKNPTNLHNTFQWKTFVAHSGSVLSLFSSYKIETVDLSGSRLVETLLTDVEMEDSESSETHYFPKFLTNQKLLKLQLSDSNFRRCVLIQFLILFQYLTSTVKFKMKLELKSDQEDWVKENTALVYKLLGETPPQGKQFAECVKQLLTREEHWISWKNDGCPDFQKPKPPEQVDSADEVKHKRPIGDIIKEYEDQNLYYMGNNELTELWNLCPDNLAACRTKERDFMPSLESYMACPKSESSVASTSNRLDLEDWRALRLLRHRTPHFFARYSNPIERVPDFLTAVRERVNREVAADASASARRKSSKKHIGIKSTKQRERVNREVAADASASARSKSSKKHIGIKSTKLVPKSTHASSLEEDEDKTARSRVTMLSSSQLETLSTKITDWKSLAAKLDFKPDEIQFFETENAMDSARAKNMLQVWFEDEKDASVENLLYILEGLKMADACEVLKKII